MKNFAKFAMIGIIGIIMLAGSLVMAGEKKTEAELAECKFKFVDFTARKRPEKDKKVGEPIENLYNWAVSPKTTIKVTNAGGWKYIKKSTLHPDHRGTAKITNVEVTLRVTDRKTRLTRVQGYFKKCKNETFFGKESRVRSQKIIVINHQINNVRIRKIYKGKKKRRRLVATSVFLSLTAGDDTFGFPSVTFIATIKDVNDGVKKTFNPDKRPTAPGIYSKMIKFNGRNAEVEKVIVRSVFMKDYQTTERETK